MNNSKYSECIKDYIGKASNDISTILEKQSKAVNDISTILEKQSKAANATMIQNTIISGEQSSDQNKNQ